MAAQLDLEDIQHFLLTRTPALAARYEFLSFESVAAGRAWLAGLVTKVGTGQSVGTASPDARWVTIAFTCGGLRPLGAEPRSPPAVRRRRARAFWLSGPPVSARHRRNWRATDAGFRTTCEGRRVLPQLRRRERCAAAAAPAGAPLAQWQLSRLPAHGGARQRVPRIPAAAIGDARPAGTAGGEADGTVAQRRTAGALS